MKHSFIVQIDRPSSNIISRIYGPGNIIHRTNGPAVETSDGYKAYYVNNELHREDGPAQTLRSGKEFYWLKGYRYDNKSAWTRAKKKHGL